MPFKTATGTSLAALLLPVGAAAAFQYYRDGHVHVVAALLIAVGIFIGAWLGATYARGATPLTLQRAFAVFLALMAVRMWLKGA
jgi:uncharacterized membrane protein YfcA